MSRDLAVAAAIVVAFLALLSYGLYQRGEAAQARGELELALAQQDVLSSSLTSCNAGADLVKRLGAQILGDVRRELQATRKANAGAAAKVDSLEKLLAQRPPPGAGCDDAWATIEKGARNE